MTATNSNPTKTRWWHTDTASGEQKIVCTLCPRECHIPEGSRGFCFVRANEGGQMVLTTYGRSSGFCIDPIEKKPLNHFLPGTPVLSLGTAGCNLGCKFCQNWDISKSREMDTLAGAATPEAIVAAAKETGCRSIAFTYNDPVIWAEYAIDIARVARAEGIKTVAVTAGYICPEARREFYQYMDAANVDLKAFTETFYRKLTQTHIQPVLDTLKYLKHETNVWFEITTLIIPGENDSPSELRELSDWVVKVLGPDVPIHFTAFHPDFKMLDKPPTPHEKLIEARQIALDAGIHYAYVGNVYDLQRESTYCHNCDKCVIQRDWYELGKYEMRGNRCAHCDTVIPGVFDNNGPGDWGRKRQPIRIQEPVKPITPTITRSPKLADHRDELLSYTRAAVEAAVLEQPIEAQLDEAVRTAPAYGMFVTLDRKAGMRACRGRFSGEDSQDLAQLIRGASADAALEDYRFPRVTAGELDRLAIDLSILHSPHTLDECGEDRIAAIRIGTHGLIISHPRGRGLLLPNVATEHGWDALTFLRQLARKANLPPEAWRDDEAQIQTFETLLLTQPANEDELDTSTLAPAHLRALVEAINASMHGKTHESDDPVLTTPHPEPLGLYALTESGRNTSVLGSNRSLLALAELAGASLRKTPDEPVTRLAVLHQPVRLSARDYPHRHQMLTTCAVLAQTEGAWALAVPRSKQPSDIVGEALAGVHSSAEQWKQAEDEGLNMPRLTAFNILGFDSRQNGDVRPAARAGQFYPGSVEAIRAALDEHFAKAGMVEQATHRAVMLPHAGWRYCGDTIAKTLVHCRVPKNVIVIGPNHTGMGAPISVAPHAQWQLPGLSLPIATDIVQDILSANVGVQREPAAHQMEHGTEVLLPFLHRMNPDLRVVPIVLGRCGYDQAVNFGQALAAIAAKHDALLVISSDMNHFAQEDENRRLDKLALDAMLKGNPRELYETCTQNQISMCGLLPAVAVMSALGSPKAQLIDYTTSAQASGDSSSVVGYAGVLLD